ncbi:glycosyltransferase family 4 protein [Bradyrhizobium sp. CIAT3101]|uniref:glycosyltransferase family 4 protein n=1 Tax=Bradyrhizobium sp. CIAT3101 TaxID=439387 RepID=UPI0024B0D416|nr:glycosyltransferase family 4 protein [Bradyrhizobium sp. CIAT3101]WFU79141.1 glycosyltransferase family 4 protein [Bradyrhizobium sp. CIAT3101]
MVLARPLKVLIATPFGEHQRGGIDRLTDLIVAEINRDPSGHVRASRLVTRGPGPRILGPFFFLWSLFQLWIAKRRGHVDLLHINVAADGSAIRKAFLARFARGLGVPYVVHLHGSRFQEFWPAAGPRVRVWVDRLFAESSAVIVLGSVWSELVRAHVPQIENRIIILPNATASADFKRDTASNGPVRISFLGELGKRKGTPQLVEALGQLNSGLNWTATIAGNGQIQETKARADQLGIGDRVKVPGWLDSQATNEVLRTSDIFVLPSFAENLPMSILEAFAYGLAVVATPVGAVADVIRDGANGILVPAGNVEALASALRRLIADSQFRAALGAAAKVEHAAKYEIGGYISRITEIWQGALVPRQM